MNIYTCAECGYIVDCSMACERCGCQQYVKQEAPGSLGDKVHELEEGKQAALDMVDQLLASKERLVHALSDLAYDLEQQAASLSSPQSPAQIAARIRGLLNGS